MMQFNQVKKKSREDSFLLVILIVSALHLFLTLLFLQLKSVTNRAAAVGSIKPLQVKYIEERKQHIAVRAVDAVIEKKKGESLVQAKGVATTKQEQKVAIRQPMAVVASGKGLEKAKVAEVGKAVAEKELREQEIKEKEAKRKGKIEAFEQLQRVTNSSSLAISSSLAMLGEVDHGKKRADALQIKLASEAVFPLGMTGESSALSVLAEQLRSILVLPQYGLVRIRVTVSSDGKLSNIKVLESKNKLNERYIIDTLSQMRLTLASTVEEMELELILSNQ